ncbi:hypothetical protein Moror_9378 [Moniliophthora roreri MCA 2997]|uniref:Protein kinase domain-containing protein n=2 Tax=Moniliophthora roreri TaxID=221103 RepID=V2Y348_MONRO|nr:hypothetical protein Moror_9378 [Moniliophthora roreri MCA 2997]KAI3613277.1 hypothetical protein WG66_001574 [Moniliophthora roreri]
MPFIQECSDFEFHNNQITVVEGSQYNTTHTIHDNRTVQVVCQERKEHTIWDEYERVRTGNVNLIKTVGTSDIISECDISKYDASWWLCNRRVVARRTISVARIRGEDKEAEFLYVGYSGPEAFQAFKRDFDEFSTVKHPNVAQLFGYNDSQHGLPALIFYDALIPLNSVLSANQAHLWATLYFRIQLHAVGMFNDKFLFDVGELWIESRSGALRRGPWVQSHARLYRLSAAPPTLRLDPLSIQTYSDTNVIVDYLVRILPIDIILKLISAQDKRYHSWLGAEAWPYLATSLWKPDQSRIIARWTGLVRYACVDRRLWIKERKIVMEDGSVRIEFADAEGFLPPLPLKYELFHDSERLGIWSVWLAQAHSIFSQLGIHEGKWEEYSITTRFELSFYYMAYRKKSASKKPTYLFVRPIPRPSDNETTWRSWAKSVYFWSFDPFGREEISESKRISLGLPSFRIEIHLWYTSWNFNTYKVMERFQHFKGFDPTTTDYAHSLSYPIIQVVEDKDCFQELGESNDDRSTSEDEELMVIEELVAVDRDSSCPDTAHRDVIPFSTPNDTLMNEIPDAETNEVTVGNKQKSKAAGSSSKRRKFHTDDSEGEVATTGSSMKRRRTATDAKNLV